METQDMPKAIAQLRMLLAAIKGKEEDLGSMKRQFRRQMERAPEYALRGNPLDASLNIMSEIQERLDGVERTLGHLEAIKSRVQAELQALELVRKIEQARSRLITLKAQRDLGDANLDQEIDDLERFVQEASVRAGEAITGSPKMRDD